MYLGQMLEKDLLLKSSPKGWHLVRIVPICSLLLSLDVNFADISIISVSHTVHGREIWGICKGDGTQVCATGMGACSIRTCQFPSYRLSSPRYCR